MGGTLFGTVRNVVIAVVGMVLAIFVLGSVSDAVRAVQLAGALDRAERLAKDGEYSHAALVARDVLDERPKATRALVGFVCYAWNAHDYDSAVAMLQYYHRFPVPTRAFDDCTGGDPIGRGLAWATVGRSVGAGGLLLTRDGVDVTNEAPSVAQLKELGDRPALYWVGVACRNEHSGLTVLADLQVRQFEANGGDLGRALVALPEAWGCTGLAGDRDD